MNLECEVRFVLTFAIDASLGSAEFEKRVRESVQTVLVQELLVDPDEGETVWEKVCSIGGFRYTWNDR